MSEPSPNPDKELVRSAIQETLRDEYRARFSELAEYRNEVWKVLTADFFSR